MSVIYQGETFEVSNEDLVQVKSELGNLSEELYICSSNTTTSELMTSYDLEINKHMDECWLEKLLERWEDPTPSNSKEDLEEDLEEEWLDYRTDSDLLESEENNYL